MPIFLEIVVLAAWAFQSAQAPSSATVVDQTHFSQAMNRTRSYRVILPPGYAESRKRYPVVYWLHGYEESDDRRETEIANYVAAHDLIVVEAGPVETAGEFPLYFPELAEHVDANLRTIPDRGHRAVAGYSIAGFMAFWIAGKYPDLVSSASSFAGLTAAQVGPRDLEAEFSLDDFYANYEGVRTRLVTAPRDSLQFYHRRLNSVWLFARPGHETAAYDFERGVSGIVPTLDFHMHAFADPLPVPAVFHHADVYPNFAIWGWEVASDRRQPGFTVLESASAKGFRSTVREWVPGGAAIAGVKLSIATAPLFSPGSSHPVVYRRVRDGTVRRATQKADGQGRLNFEMDGDAWDVSLAPEPRLTLADYQVADAAWATAGTPLALRVKFTNVGQARSGTAAVQWESPGGGVKFEPATGRLFGLAPGESAELPVSVTVADSTRAAVRIDAVEGANRMSFVVPLFPAAPPAADFRIADGQTVALFQHAVERAEVTLGEGNRDGHAAPGESFAVLLPDGGGWRAAEVFTNDACIDTTVRALDSWAEYDRSGASSVYSLPSVRPDCPPGHVVHALARVLIPDPPNHRVRYAAIEFPVWYRPGQEPR